MGNIRPEKKQARFTQVSTHWDNLSQNFNLCRRNSCILLNIPRNFECIWSDYDLTGSLHCVGWDKWVPAPKRQWMEISASDYLLWTRSLSRISQKMLRRKHAWFAKAFGLFLSKAKFSFVLTKIVSLNTKKFIFELFFDRWQPQIKFCVLPFQPSAAPKTDHLQE